MTSFDLVHQPWIPVMVAGRRGEVSLLEALTGADRIDALAVDDPLQTVAVLRQVLLPVLLDALGPPRTSEEWADRWDTGAFDAGRVTDYLEEWAGRFDLFHPETPFGQVAGLHTDKGETKPVSLLLPALASGNNVPLFSARTDADPPTLTPPEAARAMLAAHCWDTAAIKSGAAGDPQVASGKTTGNPTGPLGQLGVTIPVGASLAHTLLLNTPVLSAGLTAGDRPQWRAEAATPIWRRRPAAGLLDLLTWQSRRIRLIPEQNDDGHTFVRQIVLTAGDRLDQLLVDVEPHTSWRTVPKPRAGEAPVRPVRHQPGRAAWRGLASLLATKTPTEDNLTSPKTISQLAELRALDYLPADTWLQVLTVGVVYGNQSAIVEDVLTDQIPLPLAALVTDAPVRELLLEMAGQAEALRVAANRLGDDLRAACGADKLPWDKSQRLGDVVVHEFTPVVRRLLSGLQREPERVDEAARAWRQTARQIAVHMAEPVLNAAPPEAFLGRVVSERIAHRASTAEARYRAAITRTLGPDRTRADDLQPGGA
jgi:CRISPR system Cascade subunit CasA